MTDAQLGERMRNYLIGREAQRLDEMADEEKYRYAEEEQDAEAAGHADGEQATDDAEAERPITERLAGLVQDGRNIKGPDGRVEVFDGAPAPDSTLAEALDMWERAREQEQDAAAYVERRQAEALDALRESDEQYRAQATRLAHYEAKRKGIEAAIAAAVVRSDPDVTLSVDTGRIRLTWPKRTTRWTLAQEPEWYGTPVAIRQLTDVIRGKAEEVGLIAVEIDVLASRLTYAVLSWLAPTPKHSAPTGPRYTVRDVK